MSVQSPSIPLVLGPDANGMRLDPEEFDAADFERGWRYELIRGVLIVSPAPLRQERDPNEELGYMLRSYQDHHSDGAALDKTLSEEDVHVGSDRRRADRAIWAGLGRRPGPTETPTIIVEFVSAGRRNRQRDYEEKRDEYLQLDVREYWIIDRFDRTMTVHAKQDDQSASQVIAETATYTTPLLPGFELPIARLFALADDWDE